MFLLFGTKAVQTVLNVVTFVCGFCGVAADQRVIKSSNRITLFFIPLIPIGSSHYNECSNCGGVTELTAAQAAHSVEWARTHPGS